MIARIRNLKVYNLVAPGVCYDYDIIWRYQKALSEHSNNLHKASQQKMSKHTDHVATMNEKSSSTSSSSSSNDCDGDEEEYSDYLILVQHNSIYTLGRGATADNLRFSSHDDRSKHKVIRVERGRVIPHTVIVPHSLHRKVSPNLVGGEVTWHGPGQIVAYPIFNLNYHKKDLHWYYIYPLSVVCVLVACMYVVINVCCNSYCYCAQLITTGLQYNWNRRLSTQYDPFTSMVNDLLSTLVFGWERIR